MEMNFFYKAAGAILAPFRYAEREIENAKENLKEDARKVALDALKILLLSLCFLFFLLFATMTAASAINAKLNSAWLGFAIAAGFYLLLALVVYVWKQMTNKEGHSEKSVNTR